jgi:hypothetical protein
MVCKVELTAYFTSITTLEVHPRQTILIWVSFSNNIDIQDRILNWFGGITVTLFSFRHFCLTSMTLYRILPGYIAFLGVCYALCRCT